MIARGCVVVDRCQGRGQIGVGVGWVAVLNDLLEDEPVSGNPLDRHDEIGIEFHDTDQFCVFEDFLELRVVLLARGKNLQRLRVVGDIFS